MSRRAMVEWVEYVANENMNSQGVVINRHGHCLQKLPMGSLTLIEQKPIMECPESSHLISSLPLHSSYVIHNPFVLSRWPIPKPQRAICYVKARFPNETFEKAWLEVFNALWIPPQTNITIPENMEAMLTKSGLFSESEVKSIMEATTQKEWKDKLLGNTQKALDQGAFGAPWFWVRNGEGKEEPFFGSDRYVLMLIELCCYWWR